MQTTIARGNETLDAMFALTITPPTITTATGTQQTLTVMGLFPGDLISWNITTTGSNYNALISMANAFVSALNTLIVTWTTEGATVSSPAAQTVIFECVRPENGLAALPINVL